MTSPQTQHSIAGVAPPATDPPPQIRRRRSATSAAGGSLCMPAIRHGQNCDCCAPGAAAQSLDEVSFAKSAAAAAQAGDLFRVKSLIARNPSALHDDGYGGEECSMELAWK